MEELDDLVSDCRGLMRTPADESLYESIKKLLMRVEAKDDALRECVKYLDGYPDNVFWPRPELIARCKQALAVEK